MSQRIGSLGTTKDLEKMFETACFEQGVQGHQWKPSTVIQFWDEEAEVPGDPKCKLCRRSWKKRMEQRGLEESQIKRLFEKVGAKWDWTKREYLPYEPKKKYRKPPEKRLGHQMIWIDPDHWTEEMDASNERADREYDQVIQERERIATEEPGIELIDLIRRVPWNEPKRFARKA